MKILISSNIKKYFNTYIDFIDHYWLKYFELKNYRFFQIPNSIKLSKNYLKNFGEIDLIILQGGNDIFSKEKYIQIRREVEINLIKFGINKKIPILGICRGMQILNYFFGGNLNKIKGHMKVKHKVYLKNKFFNKKDLNVNSFHNYGIKKNSLSKHFEIYAIDKDQNIEMFKHKKKSIYGIMWHPERENDYKNLNLIIQKISSL